MTIVLAEGAGRWLAIDEGRVVDEGDDHGPPDAEDLGDVVVVPGFVDLQVNGLEAVDFWTADEEGWRRAGARLLRAGVTTYCPTLTTAALADYDEALARIEAARVDAFSRGLPAIAGAHLEGPFLGGAPGAHPRHLIRDVDVPWLAGLLERHPSMVALATLAPEADPGDAATRLLADHEVVVALGHSRCSYDDAVAAAGAGASLVTHLFNGMGSLHHREPGLVVAALADGVDLVPTLIADGVHLHPAVRDLVFGHFETIVVSDAVATGVPAVVARDGAAYLADGTLAGATALLDDAVRNLVRAGHWLPDVLDAVAVRPAEVLRLDTYGAIGLGGRADLVALDADSLDVRAVWLGGERAI